MAVSESSHEASRAVDDLYRRHGGEVYRYAFAVLGNHADAEDITQSTFLNAYRSMEQGVRPRKPSNWLLTIASNSIKERFRQEKSRPRQVLFDEEMAGASTHDDEDEGPTVGELLTALARIPPQQRQAIVLREFEGRSYKEVAAILDVTTSALETLLFRARRSLADELEHQLTCTDAQAAISRAADGRIGRKERRRLREHLAECPDCAHFARLQQKHRRALKGLMLVPIPLSLTFFKGFEGTAAAATLPAAAGAGLGGSVAATATATGGGALAGGVALKAAAVLATVSIAGGVGAVATTDVEEKILGSSPEREDLAGERIGQVAPRGVYVPGQGVALGKAKQAADLIAQKAQLAKKRAAERARAAKAKAATKANPRAAEAKTSPRPAKPESTPAAPKPDAKAKTAPSTQKPDQTTRRADATTKRADATTKQSDRANDARASRQPTG